MDIAQVLSTVFLIMGCALGVIGAWGVLRFPDFYSRMHASGITDTMCAGLFMIGLMFQFGLTLASVKLLLIFLFMLFTSPTGAHALARTAQLNGLQPWTNDESQSAAQAGQHANKGAPQS